MRKFLIVIVLVLVSISGWAQDKFSFNGYVKSMQTVYDPDNPLMPQKMIITDNLLHNRLNFGYYPNSNWSFVLQGRNRLMFGEMVKVMANTYGNAEDYAELLSEDEGFVDVTEAVFYGDGYIFHTMADRFYVDYMHGDFQARIGRQRINWGINMLWNPNDIFNTFNYFDFDYEERPGTDAVKMQYYTGAASSAEVVWKVADHWNRTAIGGMYRFNMKGYDVQFLGGYMHRNYVFGLGWSGHIGGAGFRGEATAFQDDVSKDLDPQVVAAVSADYMFSNSMFVGGGLIYNSEGKTSDIKTPALFSPNIQLSAQSLTPSRMECYLQFSYPLTPLLSADITTIMNPYDESWYTGPSVTYSLAQNVDAMLTSQLFFGDEDTEYGEIGQLYYLRLKWSF